MHIDIQTACPFFCYSLMLFKKKAFFYNSHITLDPISSALVLIPDVRFFCNRRWLLKMDENEQNIPISIWNENASSKRCTTYEFCPSVYKSTSFGETQILIGHENFGCHMRRVRKSEEGNNSTFTGITDDSQHGISSCRNQVRGLQQCSSIRTLSPLDSVLKDDKNF